MPLPNAWALTRTRNWLRELIKDYPYPGLPGINFLNYLGNVCREESSMQCIQLFGSQGVPTQIAGHPAHSLSRTAEKGALHKFLPGTSQGRIRDIPTCASLMSQEYPAQNLYL